MLYKDLTDGELILLLQQKNHAAFSEIFNRQWGVAFVHALKLVRDEDEAKDIVQEVFANIWNKSLILDEGVNIRAYIFSAVRNKVLNHIRSQNVRSNYIDLLSSFNKQYADSIIQRIEEKELLAAIDRIIESLPERMREVFELSRKYQLSHKEIAEKLGISEKTVKRQISNALIIFRSRLNRKDSLSLLIFLALLKKH